MHGGMKTYRGSAAAARHYVEADRGRADDYYLAEGTGVVERYVASPDAGVRRMEPMSGDTYEAWVVGFDPDTGSLRGRLRSDDRAVRFVEVVVNGPKSWSLAAELHPDISHAYDAAQDRAATQIIRWLAQHATTRVGPRGAQVQVPVAEIEAVTVRHYTSRAGDPHRHLHLQINARVFAEGHWRGLHTVGVRDSLDAINGIGHAAVMTDPGFREALAAHGFTLARDTGEVVQLAGFVGPFSARAAQIGRNIDRYEADWRTANPGQEPGPALLRAWDARAWADARPDKVVPRDGGEVARRWVAELHALGYRDRTDLARLDALPVGQVDREQAVTEVLSRLAARRSGWNAADIRGEVEQLIARRNVVIDEPIRGELAEDLTARTLAHCVPLTDRPGVPEHIRALTSRDVLDVEADLTERLAARANAPASACETRGVDTVIGLDDPQRDVVTALGSDAALLVIEGAAGAGKTTTLAAARTVIEQNGGRLRVVTPTLRAARVAAEQVGVDASSAAWLAYQHGFRWDEHGTWTRLAPGTLDPDTGIVFHGPNETATLRRGDVLLVDEAGMLDQDTARALLTIADEHHARVALVGDRHQLPAVGRGGVLDLAARWAAPDACLTLDTVHRFTRTETTPDGALVSVADAEYARLSLAMRAGSDAGVVFDALLARHQIQVHATEAERGAALAADAVKALSAGTATVMVADTNEQVATLNAAIRDRFVASGHVDDSHTATTYAGQRIGVGDRVTTRRNDPDLDVANRDTWTVTRVAADGRVWLTGQHGERTLPAGYVREHVELAYACTVYGVQGDTTTTAHAVIGDHSSAASAYVGMTRGREANVAHLVADTTEDARDQWVAVFGRDRADLGPAHAGKLAAREAARYAQLRPLEVVLDELRRAWTLEADAQTRLDDARQRRDLLRDIVAVSEQRDAVVPTLKHAYEQARASADDSAVRLRQLEPVVSAHAADLAATLKSEWDDQRQAARHAAQTVQHGPGRIGQRRAAEREAREHLQYWSASWQPYLPIMPTDIDRVVSFAVWFDDTPRHHAHFDAYARAAAEHAKPDYLSARQAARSAEEEKRAAWRELHQTEQHYSIALQHYGPLGHVDDPADRLADVERAIAADEAAFATARDRIVALRTEPTLRAQPAEVIDLAQTRWAADREQRAAWRPIPIDASRAIEWGSRGQGAVPENPAHDRSPGISR